MHYFRSISVRSGYFASVRQSHTFFFFFFLEQVWQFARLYSEAPPWLVFGYHTLCTRVLCGFLSASLKIELNRSQFPRLTYTSYSRLCTNSYVLSLKALAEVPKSVWVLCHCFVCFNNYVRRHFVLLSYSRPTRGMSSLSLLPYSWCG